MSEILILIFFLKKSETELCPRGLARSARWKPGWRMLSGTLMSLDAPSIPRLHLYIDDIKPIKVFSILDL